VTPDQDPLPAVNPGRGAPWTDAERAALAAARQPDQNSTNFLARFAYALGTDALTYAEGHIRTLIEVHNEVWYSRAEDPAAFPGYCIELTFEALARRILGDLLDAGWTCPAGAADQVP